MKRLIAFSVLLAVASSCSRPHIPERRPSAPTAGGQTDREHLSAAMDYLRRADEYEESQASFQVAYHLNRWLEGKNLAEPWQPDPLLNRLPRDVRDSRELKELGRNRFLMDEVKWVQEAVWMRQIATWVAQRPGERRLEEWIDQRAAEMDPLEAEHLAIATRLFDWTIRNLQLDELLPYPAEVAAQPAQQPGSAGARPVPPPQRGIPGPGYQHYPWQTLVYGRGDAWQRARVFILLCRQQGIDVVMLAFPGKTTTPRPRPWLPAALVQGQLYLFDTRLGLPIPGPAGQGIATLAEVLENPSLLDQLTIDDRLRYEIDPRDLREIIALQDASAGSLSRRMKLVEQQLTGQDRVVLTTDPTAVAERVQKCVGVAEMGIWSVPYETTWFQDALRARIQEDEQSAAQYFRDYAVFSTRNLLVRARYRHFRGEFDTQGDEKGAKTLYLETRIPRAQLEKLGTSEDVQRQLGLQRERGEREILWKARLASSEHMINQAKAHATYWLGLAQYDTGKLDAAVEWFERRTLEDSPGSPWTAGAQYNLARTYEASQNFAAAARWYETDDSSPQEHGNRLRARWLKPAGAALSAR